VDTESLELLIKSGESPTLELKVAPPRSSELAERICGFANSALGGTLIIGVVDQTFEIVGVKSISEAVDNILQAARQCKPVVPLIPSQPQVVKIRDKSLVIAHIPPNNGELYQAGNVFWIKRGTHTVGMEKRELLNFVYRQGVLSWETQPVLLATLEDLDLERVRAYLEQRPSRNRQAGRLADLTRVLLTLKCAIKVGGGTEIHPTNAGMLLFGYAPQDFLTQAEIVATYYQDNLGVRRYTDRKLLVGTLAEQIDQAEEYIKLRIPVAGRVEGFHRIDEPELPLEALREAVVNAVAHRDYSIEGTAIRLFFYPDRVEVHNPGLLMPGVSLSDLQRGIAPSIPRNPVLVTILRELPGGYMERLGSGISFMLEQMSSMGKAAPQFKEQGEFVVTFPRGSSGNSDRSDRPLAAIPSHLKAEGVKEIPEVSTNTAAFVASPSEKLVPPTQAGRQALGMQYIHKYGFITNKQYRELMGVGETTAIRDLEALVEQGSLQAVGKGRSRHYTI